MRLRRGVMEVYVLRKKKQRLQTVHVCFCGGFDEGKVGYRTGYDARFALFRSATALRSSRNGCRGKGGGYVVRAGVREQKRWE